MGTVTPQTKAGRELETWLEEFPIDEVRSRIDELERELLRWRNALSIYDSLTGTNGGSPEAGTGEKPTKPQAITLILRESGGRPQKPGDIRRAMVERGWLEDGPKAAKRFYATMSRMNAEGRILRLQDKSYVLPGEDIR